MKNSVTCYCNVQDGKIIKKKTIMYNINKLFVVCSCAHPPEHTTNRRTSWSASDKGQTDCCHSHTLVEMKQRDYSLKLCPMERLGAQGMCAPETSKKKVGLMKHGAAR